MQAHIEKSFPAFHAAAKREIVGRYSLLYTWAGSDPKAQPIALLAHQDVVPVAPGTEKDWQQPPFDGVIADGFIWGRGSWDDKGNLYSMLEAAEAMAKAGFRPKRTIYFAFGHDEETAGTAGAKSIAALLASRGIRLDFVIDEGLLITEGIMKGLDKPAALIGVAEKGYATLVLERAGDARPFVDAAARHRDRHDERGAGAAGRSPPADADPRLRSRRCSTRWRRRCPASTAWCCRTSGCSSRCCCASSQRAGRREAMVRTTTALTIFNAGDKDNVLPGNAEATVNFRLIPGDTQGSVIDHVRSTIANDRISIKPFPGNTDPPPVTATASPSFQMLNRTIREIYPDVIVAPGLMVAATDSRHYTGITDKIFRFSPVRANSEDLKRFHGTNERLCVEGYADMIRFYRRLIENGAG